MGKHPDCIRAEDAVNLHSDIFGLRPLIIDIIHSRGHDTPEAIRRFIDPRYSDMHGPFEMHGMREAVTRIRNAIDAGEKIGIFADSDLDGITSLALLKELLNRFRIEPHLRYLTGEETYGMTDEIVDEFHRAGVGLIITVDAGTRDVPQIARARSLGMDVIVTDHHEEDSVLPDAIIVNPRIERCCYPFKHLAGVGVAFKLCHALLLSYLPSYQKTFWIACPSGNGFDYAIVKDYSILRIENSLSREELMHAFSEAGADSRVIIHSDEGTLTSVREMGITAHDFSDFIGVILSLPGASFDSICERLSMYIKLHGESIDTLAAILLEAQIIGSEKVRSFIDAAMGLVAIGSIADVVPLEKENRVLVKKGLDGLNAVSHPSISLLLNGNPATGRSIGWTVAPLLNTPGRVGRTELAVQFFIERDRVALRRIVSEIRGLNDERREFIAQFCSGVLEDIRNGNIDDSGGIIDVRADGIPEGYAGLIANRITDATGKPVIVSVMPPKKGLVKGSGRSRGGTPFFSIVQELRGRFDRIGGHENAFGFTALHEDLDGILAEISAMVKGTSINNLEQISGDCAISVKDIDVGLIRQVGLLEPFGSGNPEPLFRSSGIIPLSFNEFGSRHGKYHFNGNQALTAIGWGMADAMRDYFESGNPLDLLYRLENNTFNGTIRPRMILSEIEYSSS